MNKLTEIIFFVTVEIFWNEKAKLFTYRPWRCIWK